MISAEDLYYERVKDFIENRFLISLRRFNMISEDLYYERVKDFIENMAEPELVSLWNMYCDEANYWDDQLYYMCELDDILYDKTPTDIINMLGDSFDSGDQWFVFDGYGYIQSTDSPSDYIDTEELVAHISENRDCLYNDGLQDLLDELERHEEIEDDDYVQDDKAILSFISN